MKHICALCKTRAAADAFIAARTAMFPPLPCATDPDVVGKKLYAPGTTFTQSGPRTTASNPATGWLINGIYPDELEAAIVALADADTIIEVCPTIGHDTSDLIAAHGYITP